MPHKKRESGLSERKNIHESKPESGKNQKTKHITQEQKACRISDKNNNKQKRWTRITISRKKTETGNKKETPQRTSL